MSANIIPTFRYRDANAAPDTDADGLSYRHAPSTLASLADTYSYSRHTTTSDGHLITAATHAGSR